jgi:glycine/D-amino acid oxidase-like deaminating enzyme/nitrite reductase/ring-hydroxylating ferredoxin subunit
MTSLWLDRPLEQVGDPFPEDGSFDEVVVGAGLTGLTTALLLARAGRRVGVVEARHVGAVTTGRTTAKVSLLQGTKLSQLLSRQSEQVARAYVEANLEGKEWLLRFCRDHGVAVQPRDAVVYAAQPSELGAVRREHDAAAGLGLDVEWRDRLDVPFPNHGAVVLADQAQFDPMEVLAALVEQVKAHGGTVHEGHRVVSVSKSGRPELRLDSGRTLSAENVVLATGMPIVDRVAAWAKAEPQRSYLIAYEGPAAPSGMYLSAGSSSRSLRDVPVGDGRSVFLVGGSGHTVGRTRSERLHLDELRAWTQAHFPGAVETHAWSAQDYSPYDGVPLVGPALLGGGSLYYATGYDKWGMTNAVAAALQLSASLLGGEVPEWARTMAERRPSVSGALQVGRMNTGVGLAEAVSTARAGMRTAEDLPAEGTGVVGREGLVPTGTSTIDGRTCKVLAICTHVGGTLKWNDAERSWDCPLHGSRFAPDGQVLEGPATRPLRTRTV